MVPIFALQCHDVDMRVGIRELQQHASSVIRRVANGESVEVTDRGRPVARIVPIATGRPYDRMVAAGEIAVGNGRWAEIDPLSPLPGRSLSDGLVDGRSQRADPLSRTSARRAEGRAQARGATCGTRRPSSAVAARTTTT